VESLAAKGAMVCRVSISEKQLNGLQADELEMRIEPLHQPRQFDRAKRHLIQLFKQL